MADEKTTLLIVEDDLDIADMLTAYFRVQGYEVFTVNWGEDAIRSCQVSVPDLVILDIRLPDIDGFEVAKRLRDNRRTQDVPIIFLTEKRERHDRLKGLELHADDYITKPFDVQELRLRVRNTLQRHNRSSLTNPITGLPEGSLVDESLARCLSTPDWAVMVLSLKNIDRFREVYGFVASDDLLRAVAIMLQDELRTQGNSDDFIGQVGLADYLIVTRPMNVPGLKDRLLKRVEQSLDFFYRDQDRNAQQFQQQRIILAIKDINSHHVQPHDMKQLKALIDQLYR